MNAQTFKVGDKVRFRRNGVTGIVTEVRGPSVNTLTGNPVIIWHAPGDGGQCVHETSELEVI